MKPLYSSTRHVWYKTVLAVFALCAWTAALPAQDVKPDATKAFIYWTNNNNGSIGRATVAAADVKENFIPSQNGSGVGGAGLTMNSDYIYWSTANGGTATNIGRANLNGTDPDESFITGAANPCGVAVNGSYIYWYGDGSNYIGRANLDGSDVNQEFIDAGDGGCGLAVTKNYIYWGSYRSGYIGRATLAGKDVKKDFIEYDGGGIAIEGDYIYYTLISGTAIGRVELNGSNLNASFITGLTANVAFLAVNSKYIFWANWEDGNTIGRANIDGTDVNLSFITGTDNAFGIAVTDGNP